MARLRFYLEDVCLNDNARKELATHGVQNGSVLRCVLIEPKPKPTTSTAGASTDTVALNDEDEDTDDQMDITNEGVDEDASEHLREPPSKK